jgi:hypothetical protein
MGDNNIGCRAYSSKHKKILEEAAKKHYTNSFSGFLKVWIVVICRLVQAGISAELLIANIESVINFCNNNLKDKDTD